MKSDAKPSLQERCKTVAPRLYAVLDWKGTENEVWGDGWFDDYYSLQKNLTNEQLLEVEKLLLDNGESTWSLCSSGYLDYA